MFTPWGPIKKRELTTTLVTGKKPSNKTGGFTLIEVCLAMFIVALVVGIGLPFATGISRENLLREPAAELKQLALTARRRAVTNQKSVEILLENDRYVMRDAAVAQLDTKRITEAEKKLPEISSYELPKTISYVVKRWDETKFSTKADARWRFLPNGICEPITVRFARDEDFVQFSFNPLTAQTEDESFLFR